jgi:3,4-dihydroxy 2-butanone 4-phosphate synthase/GTP cyclohydrolase II
MGDVTGDEPALVRVHTHSLAEDVFGIGGSRELIDGALREIAEAGRGAFVYLHSGTRGFAIDRAASPPRIVLQREQRAREHTDDRNCRTLRQVGLGGQILSDLGIHKIRLLTNTPTHVPALQGFGIEIVEQVPLAAGRVLSV